MPSDAEGPAADWQLVAASVTGRGHELQGTGNQDAFAVATAADGSLLLAVADGAGSALRSAEGARTATEAAVACLASAPQEGTEERLLTAFRQARSAVTRKAARLGLPAREFASTLLIVSVAGDSLGALQLGDGAVVVRSGSGVSRLTPPWRSDHAGETVFLTSPGADAQLRLLSRPLGTTDGIALLTDGLEPVATDMLSGRPYPPFFGPLFSFAAAPAGADAARQAGRNAELAKLLGSERIRNRTHDDTTLVLASLGSGP